MFSVSFCWMNLLCGCRTCVTSSRWTCPRVWHVCVQLPVLFAMLWIFILVSLFVLNVEWGFKMAFSVEARDGRRGEGGGLEIVHWPHSFVAEIRVQGENLRHLQHWAWVAPVVWGNECQAVQFASFIFRVHCFYLEQHVRFVGLGGVAGIARSWLRSRGRSVWNIVGLKWHQRACQQSLLSRKRTWSGRNDFKWRNMASSLG